MFNMKQKKIIYHFERAFIEANETNFFGRWEPSLMGCFSNLSKLSMFLQYENTCSKSTTETRWSNVIFNALEQVFSP